MTAPNGMSGGLRLNTRHNDAKIRFYTTRSSTTALRMDIDHEGIDIQGVELYSSTSASLTTTATDFYVNSTGTITTGTWNGSTLGSAYGGTGLTAAAKGSVLVANAANTFSALDGGGSDDKILFYNQQSDTITWESSLDAGTF